MSSLVMFINLNDNQIFIFFARRYLIAGLNKKITESISLKGAKINV